MKFKLIFMIFSFAVVQSFAQQILNENDSINLFQSNTADSSLIFETSAAETVFVKAIPETVKVIERNFTPLFSYPAEKKETGEVSSIRILQGINLKILFEIVIIFLIGLLLVRLIEAYRRNLLTKKSPPLALKTLTVIQVILWIAVIYLIASVVLLNSRDLFIIILISSIIVIGFSAVPIFKNILGGFYIFVKKPFSTQDYIKLNNGIEGNVKRINWRSTAIIGSDKNLIEIPNSMFNDIPFEIIEFRQKEELIILNFSFPFNFDVDEVMRNLKEAAISSPFSFIRKAPQIFLEETDYVQKVNKFKLSVYVFDSNYRDELISSINRFIIDRIQEEKEFL